MTARRVGCGALVAVVLVVGAAGWSSAQDNRFCGFEGRYAVEGTSSSTRFSTWPPGWRCVHELPGERAVSVESGSVSLFVGLLGVELLFAIWLSRCLGRVPRAARLAAVTVLALSVSGAGGLVGGFLFAGYVGVLFGIPGAYFADRALLRAEIGSIVRRGGLAGATCAAFGGLLAACLWLYGLGGIASLAIAVGTVALAATLAPGRSPQPV